MKILKHCLIFSLTAVTTMPCFSQTTSYNEIYKPLLTEGKESEAWKFALENVPEWNLRSMRGLCLYVGGADEMTEIKGRYKWKYQERILEAAGADMEGDTEAEVSRKVSEMWNANDELFTCNNPRFDVQNGSVIKYAVSLQFTVFLLDIIAWNVNLNKVDNMDGGTVLDYIQEQIERTRNDAPVQDKFKDYYSRFREAGAKHQFELEAGPTAMTAPQESAPQ